MNMQLKKLINNSIIIIPVRMGSSRFPGKPLIKIKKETMVGRIYRICKSSMIKNVVVATCDKEIVNHLKKIKASYILTKKTHKRASDRTSEAIIKLEKKNRKKFKLVVMVQGDEPMIDKEMVNKSIIPFLKNDNIQVVNLISSIKSKKELYSKNTIKIVKNHKNEALYFSRQVIPFDNQSKTKFYKQVCIIPFERNFLFKYSKLKHKSLEISESIDMLRVLESGYKINLVKTNKTIQAVDTKEDLSRVLSILK
jgi:3-deoxy-manno-octulosonate cytidylyltransferase (CMP-KDO synthetase)